MTMLNIKLGDFMMQNVLSSEHTLGNRMLEVKVATPKVLIKLMHKIWNHVYCVLAHGRCTYIRYSDVVVDFTTDSWNAFILKEEMRAPAKKATRIFVARIPPSVTEATFRRSIECDTLIKIIGIIFYFGFGDVVSYKSSDYAEEMDALV